MPVAPTARAALAGALAAALGLGVAELTAGALSVATTPVLAVGQAVVALVPGGVAERAVAVLGSADKPVLVLGVVLATLGAGALVGVLAARRFPLGMVAAVLLPAVGGWAALGLPGSGSYDVLPSVVGGLVAVLALPPLLDALAAPPAPQSTTTSWSTGTSRGLQPPRGAHTPREAERRLRTDGATGRRDVLRVVGVAGGLAMLATVAGRVLERRRGAVETARGELEVPATPAVAPGGADLDVAGVTPWVTPVAAFYRVDTALAVPLVDPATWRVRVHGLVDRELEVSLDDLVARPRSEAWVTLTCVSNEVGGDLAGNAWWTGAPLRDLLRDAGPRPSADCVLSTSVDGMTISTPLEALVDGRGALLAYAMDGEPLPVEHGFPVRMVVPGLYGYVSATKWVTDLEVTRFADVSAYWTSRGWAERAPVKTASRIDVPRDGARLPPGRTAVAGVAWAQHRGVRGVEVRVDDEPWQQARLGAVPSDDTWRQWVLAWDATPGRHVLTVRATDGTGRPQTPDEAPPVPDGASGWHAVTVDVT